MSKLGDMVKKMGGGKAEAEPDPKDKGEANEAGRALLAAVKAGDAAAVEEAIRACVDGYDN